MDLPSLIPASGLFPNSFFIERLNKYPRRNAPLAHALPFLLYGMNKQEIQSRRKGNGDKQMSEEIRPMVMTVCPQESFEVPAEMIDCFWQVPTGREALAILRMFHVDLLLVSLHLPDISTWELVRDIRARNSCARWALLAPDLETRDEVNARALGVLSIYHQRPGAEELYQLALRIRQSHRDYRVSV
jgi:CheY-like chemotaxis protein